MLLVVMATMVVVPVVAAGAFAVPRVVAACTLLLGLQQRQ
jgi:hypothetical protein